MRDHTAGISRPDSLIDRSQLPLLRGDKILHRLLDDPRLRPVESGSNRRHAVIEGRIQAEAYRRGFAHF
jgi:hypothetical protein